MSAERDAAAPIQLSRRDAFERADVRVEPSMLSLQGPAGRVLLEPRVMQLLVALADSNGAVASRETLLAQCWAGAVVGDDALHRAVAGARRALRDAGTAALSIETIARVGYRLAGTEEPAPVDVPVAAQALPLPHAAPAPVPVPVPVPISLEMADMQARGPGQRRVWVLAAVAAVAAVTVGAVGVMKWQARRRGPLPAEVQALLEQARRASRLATRDGDSQAVGLLDDAVHRAPWHAPAWGELALARHSLSTYADSGLLPAALSDVEAAAARALKLNPQQPDALTARALLVPHFGRWSAVDDLLHAVLATEPEHAPALDALSYLLSSAGQLARHYPLRLKTVELDPLHAGYNFRAIYSHWMNGQTAAADRAGERGTQLWPLHLPTWLARTDLFVYTGRPDRALALLDAADSPFARLPQLQATLRITATALSSESRADRGAARAALLRTVEAGGPLAAVKSALDMAALDEVELAVDLVEAFLLERGPRVAGTGWRQGQPPHRDLQGRMTNYLFLPVMASVRAHPRFAAIARDVGLTAYWHRPDRRSDAMASAAAVPGLARHAGDADQGPIRRA